MERWQQRRPRKGLHRRAYHKSQQHTWGEALLPYKLPGSRGEEMGPNNWLASEGALTLTHGEEGTHRFSLHRQVQLKSLNEEIIYAQQPTAPSELRNSLFLRLIPHFAMICWRTYSGVGIFGFSESSIPAHQPPPLLCPVCPQLQESQQQCLFQEEKLTTTLCSTSPQHLWATEFSTGGQAGSPTFTQLIDIIYKVLLMPKNGTG